MVSLSVLYVPYVRGEISVGKPHMYTLAITSGFLPRVRATVFLSFGLINTQNGGLCAPPPPPIAASLLLIHPPKIKINYRTRAARVKGVFLSTGSLRPPSIQSTRLSIQSSKWVPRPSPARECCSPPLRAQRGGDTLTCGGGGGDSIPMMGRTL
jgi:hypothetical protein